MEKGFLVLETGDIFTGVLIGEQKQTMGEVVFNTSMTGYQQMLTDPSYAGQILTFCYPLIGNYGLNLLDSKRQPYLAGVVLGEWCEQPSHELSSKSFVQQLAETGVTGLAEVDTRALVKTIREKGTVRGVITQSLAGVEEADFWQKLEQKQQEKTTLVEQVSIQEQETYYPEQGKENGKHLALVDFGYKQAILDSLLALGTKVTVVPYQTTLAELKSLQPDGVLFSNGPGNPLDLAEYFSEIKQISSHYPTLGICLGHLVLAAAHGAQPNKMKFGHRGANYPVKEVANGKVIITTQNHGYELNEQSIDQSVFKVTHYNVNDRSIEGLQHQTLPIFSVQFYPEAVPGPTDTTHIYTQFLDQMKVGDKDYALA